MLKRTYVWGICAGIFLLVGCVSAPQQNKAAWNQKYEAAADLNLKAYKKIGMVVARVGNLTILGCPAHITLETDYANTKAETVVHMLFDFASKDVCIEKEERIKAAFPHYPYWEMWHNKLRWEKYYKNLTPLMEQTVSESLSQTGFEVMNLKQAFQAKSLDSLEMKVKDIVAAAQDLCDAVLLFNYTEMGDNYSDTTLMLATGYGSEGGYKGGRGLKFLMYSFALFDVQKSQRVLSVWSNGVLVPQMLQYDPDIQNDPRLAGRIKSTSKSGSNYKSESVEYTFTEEEILAFTMKALRRGYRYKEKPNQKEEKTMGLDDYWIK
jgi:hypothetical protein